ncbi:hypothetical protein KAW18_16225 [candidate division WOR-3 bacterium]|nr:hypothetical protein [candidate division WOR-3 bacterium]
MRELINNQNFSLISIYRLYIKKINNNIQENKPYVEANMTRTTKKMFILLVFILSRCREGFLGV